MASFFFFLLLLLPLLSTTSAIQNSSTTTISAASVMNNTSTATSSVATTPPAFSQEIPPQQLQFDAEADAPFLNGTCPALFRSSVGDGVLEYNRSFSGAFVSGDPLLFPYHIQFPSALLIPDSKGTCPASTPLPTAVVSRHVNSSELLLFPTGAYLLPGNTFLITKNSTAATLTRPRLFQNSIVRVHNVGDGVLEYAMLPTNLAQLESVHLNITFQETEVSMASRRDGLVTILLILLLTIALDYLELPMLSLVTIAWGIYVIFYGY